MQPEQPIQPVYSPPPMQQTGARFSQKQKLLFYVVGILVAIFIILFVASLVFGGKESPNQASINSVYSRNAVILKLLDKYGDELRTAEGVSYVSRSNILITSDTLSLKSYAGTASKEQTADFDFATISSGFEKSIPQSDFDEIFIATINDGISTNKALLEGLDYSAIGPTLEPIISTAIANYDSLLE